MHFGRGDWSIVLRDIGSVLRLSSIAFLIPVVCVLAAGEAIGNSLAFIAPAAMVFLAGWALRKSFKKRQETDIRHALVSIAIIWLVFAFFAGIPFVLLGEMGFSNSAFEAMSALTTTGLSVANPDAMAKSTVLWRSILSWIGGLGFVVMASIGVFGATRASKLIIAEGREQHVKANLRNAAKELFGVYLAITVLGLGLLWAGGLSGFDALNISMSAVSTTGMTPSSSALAGASPFTVYSLVLVLLLGGTSLTTHYLFFRRRQWTAYWRDAEFKLLLLITVFCTLVALVKLEVFYGQGALQNSLLYSAGAATNGGFTPLAAGQFAAWPGVILLLLLTAMFIGGSTGSTSGGIKIGRARLFAKSLWWRAKESVSVKNLVYAKRLGENVVSDEQVGEAAKFIAFYATFILLGAILLTAATGAGFGAALFEATSAQSNAGLSMGIVGPTMGLFEKAVLFLNMWIGRLEILPVLALAGALLAKK